MTDESRWVFNRLARSYRARIGYPRSLIDRLVELGRPGPVLDLGAGTGQLALPIAAAGLPVVALEPARAMLEVLREDAARSGLTVSTVHAAAEDTGLPADSAQLALIADALHWIDPELAGHELGRLVKRGGRVAFVDWRFAQGTFVDALQPLLHEANPRAKARDPVERRAQLAREAGCLRPLREELFVQDELLDDATLEGTLRSLSFIGPALGEDAVARLVVRAKALAAEVGGARWARTLQLTWCERT